MYGVEKRFKMQLLLGLKGSPLVGAGIRNFVTPEYEREVKQKRIFTRKSPITPADVGRSASPLYRINVVDTEKGTSVPVVPGANNRSTSLESIRSVAKSPVERAAPGRGEP